MNLSYPETCSCGRDHHQVKTPRVEIGSGILDRSGDLLKETFGGKHIHVVWDQNTKEASGNLSQKLEEAGYTITSTLYDDMQWATLEEAERIAKDGDGADLFLAVGTGSINDMTKYASYHSGKPMAVFATAPSMDGFLSIGAALYHDGFKDSFDTACPQLVLGDQDVLGNAPVRLKAAGFGDLIGKYTALCDWKAAHILTGEYWCPTIVKMTEDSVKQAIALCDQVPENDPKAAAALMEGLCLSGLAMLLSGNSRPASGAEHHFSHFWEMVLIRDGIRPDLHGRKVGVAAGIVADLYHEAAEKKNPVFKKAVLPKDGIEKVYGSLSNQILKENTPDPLADIQPEDLKRCWPEIKKEIDQLPSGSEIAEWISRAGGPVLPQQVGISVELTRDALKYATYTRKRLTILRLLTMMN